MTALQSVSFMAGNLGMCVSCPGMWHKGHPRVPEVSKHIEVALEESAERREPRRTVPGVCCPSTSEG